MQQHVFTTLFKTRPKQKTKHWIKDKSDIVTFVFDISVQLAHKGTVNSHFGYVEMLFVTVCIPNNITIAARQKPWQLASGQLILFGLLWDG